jgi:hypothetical protein
MNPLAAMAQLYRDTKPTLFLGSCFALWDPQYFVTAAHCVHGLEADEVVIRLPHHQPISCTAVLVERHPSADLAVLHIDTAHDGVEPFTRITAGYALGLDFYAHGFPEDVFGKDARKPIARTFRGYFQRFLEYQSFLGYQYSAGELSIQCPAGLSGGCIFPSEHLQLGFVYGVATENLRSTTILQAVEELQSDGVQYRELYQQVISYGICVLLRDYEDWLRNVIPNSSPSPSV